MRTVPAAFRSTMSKPVVLGEAVPAVGQLLEVLAAEVGQLGALLL